MKGGVFIKFGKKKPFLWYIFDIFPNCNSKSFFFNFELDTFDLFPLKLKNSRMYFRHIKLSLKSVDAPKVANSKMTKMK